MVIDFGDWVLTKGKMVPKKCLESVASSAIISLENVARMIVKPIETACTGDGIPANQYVKVWSFRKEFLGDGFPAKIGKLWQMHCN